MAIGYKYAQAFLLKEHNYNGKYKLCSVQSRIMKCVPPQDPNLAGLDINLSCWAGDVSAPMVFVHWILLVNIKFEEFIVAIAFEILVSGYHDCQ